MTTTADLLAGTVMDAAAALLNDVSKSRYTYVVQVPYLNIASADLKELYELNNMPVTEETSTVIQVDAGVEEVGFSPTPPIVGTPYLPNDLIEPQLLWQRQRGIDPYIPINKVTVLPQYLAGVPINQIVSYVWESQKLKFLPSDSDLDIKMNYIKNIFATIVDNTSVINIVNAQSFLTYRTAALCAEFIDEDTDRADRLNGNASNAIDRALGIGTKGRQSIMVRRKPFRAAFKRRHYV